MCLCVVKIAIMWSDLLSITELENEQRVSGEEGMKYLKLRYAMTVRDGSVRVAVNGLFQEEKR